MAAPPPGTTPDSLPWSPIQQSTAIHPIELTEQDQRDIVAFLKLLR
jgi:hypothetical protein